MSVKKDFVYIFLHIPKTAGSTLVKNIVKSLGKGESLEINPKTLGVGDDLRMEEYKKRAAAFISKQKISKR